MLVLSDGPCLLGPKTSANLLPTTKLSSSDWHSRMFPTVKPAWILVDLALLELTLQEVRQWMVWAEGL